MPNLSSIFLGGVTAEPRKFLRAVMEHYRLNGQDRVYVPCTGQFTIVKCCLEAGIPAENIFTSDVSLFSTVLGYLYSGQPLSEIIFEIVDPEVKIWYDEQPDDIHRAAVLFLVMKWAQLRKQVFYENTFRTELMVYKEKYKDQLVETLKANVEIYKGINYQVMDVRDLFSDKFQYQVDDIVIMNPPAFSKGYEKMFSFGEFIKYEIPVAEFDFAKEWIDLYMKAKREIGVPFLYYTSKDVKKMIPEGDVVFAKEDGKDKFSYFLSTRPETLDGFDEKFGVMFKNSKEDVTIYELYDKERMLELTDEIVIKPINKATALYYRDLFAHRLGATVAEIYFGIFINGKFVSTCGFNTSFLRRLQETYIFENFCFSISHDKYENLNRLSMMCLVSGQFKKFLEATELKNSSYVELKTFRTVCLLKYRKSKLNNGLLKLMSSDRQENGTYKAVYENPFYMERDYKECLRIFLEKDVRFKKEKLSDGEGGVNLEGLK